MKVEGVQKFKPGNSGLKRKHFFIEGVGRKDNLVVQQVKVAAEKVGYRFVEIYVAEFCARYNFLLMKKSN